MDVPGLVGSGLVGCRYAMNILVNGESQDVPPQSTVSQLLEQLRVAPERVVVELNLKILKRAEHPASVLKDGDRVEIVHFVGGGAIRSAEFGVRNSE